VRSWTHQRPAHAGRTRPQPPPGRAARPGGAGDRASGQRVDAAVLAWPAVPGPGRLPGRRGAHLPRPMDPLAMTADVEEVEVVVAHQERITLRVGDVFVKLDADRSRLDVEVEAMTIPPVPTPEILWRKPHELALAALPGTALGRLGQPSPSSPAAWAAAGAAVRTLHDAP